MESTFAESDWPLAWCPDLRRALAVPVPYELFERPGALPPADQVGGRSIGAAVLIALAEQSGRPHLLVTRRTETVGTHKGQFAFPGGVGEPFDVDAEATALREAQEEVGLDPRLARIWGKLETLRTPTGFEIVPCVATLRESVSAIALEIEPGETAEAFWVDWQSLTAPGVYRRETLQALGREYTVHVFQVGDRRIWGATAAMIKNLLDRVQRIG